jgi:hypothetical protein
MATQGYSTAPGRNSANAVGKSAPRSVSTKAVPIIKQAMAASQKLAKPTKGKSK